MRLIPEFVHRRIAHRPSLVRIVENIGWLFLDKFLRMGVGLFVGVWVARYLGPEKFGLLSFAGAFVGLFAPIAGLGLQGIVVRDIVRSPQETELTLGTAAMLQGLGGLIAYLLALSSIFLLRPEDQTARLLVAILGSVMLLRFSEAAVYWFESQVLSKYIVWVQNCCFLALSALKVWLILQSASVVAFAWVALIEAALVAALVLYMLGSRGPSLQLLRCSVARARYLVEQSWPLMLSGLAITVYLKIDLVMLGQMLGDDSAGIYSAASRLGELWYFLPGAIVGSVFPAIIRSHGRDEVQFYVRLQKLFDMLVWLSIGLALPITFFSTTLVTRLFGDSFAEAGMVLAIHVWATVFVFLGVASGRWFLVEGLQTLMMHRAISGAVLNVVLNYFLIPVYGVTGAAFATVASHAVSDLMFDISRADTRRVFYMKLRAFNIFRVLADMVL